MDKRLTDRKGYTYERDGKTVFVPAGKTTVYVADGTEPGIDTAALKHQMGAGADPFAGDDPVAGVEPAPRYLADLDGHTVDWGDAGAPEFDPARNDAVWEQMKQARLGNGASNLPNRDALTYLPTTIVHRTRLSGTEIGVVDGDRVRVFSQTPQHVNYGDRQQIVNSHTGQRIGQRTAYQMDDGGTYDVIERDLPGEQMRVVIVDRDAYLEQVYASMTDAERKATRERDRLAQLGRIGRY